MQAAIIESGVVINVIDLANDDDPADFGAIAIPEDVGKGWGYVDGVFSEPAPDVAAWREGAKVNRTQFCLALKRANILTAAEAVLAAQGEWPTKFGAVLTNTPDLDPDEAKIIWAGATEINRMHPLIAPLQAAEGLTDEQVDALFGG